MSCETAPCPECGREGRVEDGCGVALDDDGDSCVSCDACFWFGYADRAYRDAVTALGHAHRVDRGDLSRFLERIREAQESLSKAERFLVSVQEMDADTRRQRPGPSLAEVFGLGEEVAE